jgi:hypothetical protein
VSQLRRLLDLLEDYGAAALAAAIAEALTREAPSGGTIAHLLGQQRRRRGLDRRLRPPTRAHSSCASTRSATWLTMPTPPTSIVTRRYDQKSIVLTTNLAFRECHTIFPNASCAVGLIDRLTHHAAIIKITGDSYRLREAERH